MILAVIADDLTGAFDTGVQFHKRGARVGFALLEQLTGCHKEVDVMVIDTESRHDIPSVAYQKTHKAVCWAKSQRATYYYVKTDSGLRGNVGSSLKAALDASTHQLAAFAPAYPDMNRITRNGRQLIDGLPITQSVYGKDPFDPVRVDTVCELIEPYGLQSRVMKIGGPWNTETKKQLVAIFDAETNQDFSAIAQFLQAQNRLHVSAGCAGFATHLYPYLPLPDIPRPQPYMEAPLLVICGSINPVSRAQIQYGEAMGCTRVTITPKTLMESSHWKTKAWRDDVLAGLDMGKSIFIDTGFLADETEDSTSFRGEIANCLGEMAMNLLEAKQRYTMMIIGGDTLMGFLQKTDNTSVLLEGEITPGVVVFSITTQNRRVRMLSKSGGFGQEFLFRELLDGMHEGKDDE